MPTRSRHQTYADAVLVVHVLFMVYFLFGAFFSLHHPTFAIFQCILVVVSVVLPQITGICPFTQLELIFRRRHDPTHIIKHNSFCSHYFFDRLLGWDLTMWQADIALFIVMVIPNIIPFLIVFHVLKP